MRHLLLLTVLLVASPVHASDALYFLVGDWATVQNGLGLTVIARAEDGVVRSASMTDDGNRVGGRSIYEVGADGIVIRTLIGSGGQTARFTGSFDAAGRLVFLQTSFGAQVFDTPPVRVIYAPTDSGFTMDWQSRGADGSFWSEGDPLVFTRIERPRDHADRIAFISDREGNWEIHTMNVDGSDVRNLSNHPGGDHFPQWIAGGTRLAFRSQRSRDDGGWERHEIDRDGTDLARVDIPGRLPNPDFGTFPQVHPSGSYVVNTVERGETQHVYVWRYDGSEERIVAPGDGPDYHARFSPDGERILFLSERDGNSEIYSVAFDGTDLRRLTDDPGRDRYCEWSPDGAWIAFASDRDHGSELDLYVMRADGSDVRRLTETDEEEGEISWSPDGRSLCFRSNAYGNAEVCTVDIETGEVVNLTNDPGYDGEPVWSPSVD